MMILLLVFFFTFIYLYVSTNVLRISRVIVGTSKVDGFKYLHITDIHGKVKFVNGRLSEIINREEPDFVLLTGDIISKLDEIDRVISELKEIKCRIYMVLGNYERECYDNFNKVKLDIKVLCDALESAENITLLVNEEVNLSYSGKEICVFGFDNSCYGNELYYSNHKTYDYKILLAHSPNIIKVIEQIGISYNHLLVGHTHGGQIRIGKLALNKYSQFHVGDQFNSKGNIFTINKGIGTTKIPLRINASPEIRLYKVYAKSLGSVIV